MGEESVFPVRVACPEPPTGAVDRCLQICRSRRWLQVRLSSCPLLPIPTPLLADSFSTGTPENLGVMVFVNLLVHQIHLLSFQL